MVQSLFSTLQVFLKIYFPLFPKPAALSLCRMKPAHLNEGAILPHPKHMHMNQHSVFWVLQLHFCRTWDSNAYVRADRDCGLRPGVDCGPRRHRGGYCLHHPRPALRWSLQTPRALVSCTLEGKVRIQICQHWRQYRRKESGKRFVDSNVVEKLRRTGKGHDDCTEGP